MLKTFFGCCPLRNVVSFFAIMNVFLNIGEICLYGIYRSDDFDAYNYKFNNRSEPNGEDNNDNITTENDSGYLGNWDKTPVMSAIFMDYIFIISVSWIVLKLVSNICLKQATFNHSVEKIYLWLTVYYASFFLLPCHIVNCILKKGTFNPSYLYLEDSGTLIMNTIETIMTGFQIFIVHSYYVLEKKAVVSDFVQLKWKYVSKGKIVSSGVDYPSTSTFKAVTMSQTEDSSRTIPPYITSVLRN